MFVGFSLEKYLVLVLLHAVFQNSHLHIWFLKVILKFQSLFSNPWFFRIWENQGKTKPCSTLDPCNDFLGLRLIIFTAWWLNGPWIAWIPIFLFKIFFNSYWKLLKFIIHFCKNLYSLQSYKPHGGPKYSFKT